MDGARILARIPKSERAEIRVQVGAYKGRQVLDVREWWRDKNGGDWRPGYRGLTVGQALVPQIAEALAAAVAAIKDGQTTQTRTESVNARSDAPNAFARRAAATSSTPIGTGPSRERPAPMGTR